jgi:type IV pilus assembly protein PilM
VLDAQKLLDNIIDQAKEALNLGPKTIFGVDIGLSAVKVAEVEKVSENKFKLLKYAAVQLPEASLIEDEIQKEDAILEALQKAIKLSKISTSQICLGLFGPNTVTRKLQLAGGSDEEIDDQVSWEAEQYLPFGIDESSVAFHIIGENEGGGVDIIIAAARNDIILSFRELVEKANLKIKIIDMGMLAITNVFENVMGDKLEVQGESWIIIDIGAQKTEFIIYKNGMIAFTKEMNIGGVMITEEIQRQMGVNYFEAEMLKIKGDGSGNLPEEIIQIIDDVVEAFYSEIKKTIDFYVSSTSDESLVGCLMTGGGVLIPGLIEGLEALLGVECSVLNPFDSFDYDKKEFSEEIINEIAYTSVTALGLAMRQIES